VFEDAEWQALVAAMGAPAWAADARFLAALGREAKQSEIDGQLAEWTRGSRPIRCWACRRRRACRSASQGFRELPRDPQLAHRRHLTLDHAAPGPLAWEALRLPALRQPRASTTRA
jgi:crotonobetainyl-CoA:carnitine CoA-transferase CaiB-like acyl-CoA transferase